jgi:hypothetical protein
MASPASSVAIENRENLALDVDVSMGVIIQLGAKT